MMQQSEAMMEMARAQRRRTTDALDMLGGGDSDEGALSLKAAEARGAAARWEIEHNRLCARVPRGRIDHYSFLGASLV